jgi:hypothetical protein
MTRSVSLLVVAVLLVVTAVAASASSVFLVPDKNMLPGEDTSLLMTESKAFFIQQGYEVVDDTAKADYTVAVGMQAKKNAQGNLCGYLACGIFGAIKHSATVTITASVTKGDAQVWQGTGIKKIEGSKWFGTFEDGDALKSKAIKGVLPIAFASFITQCPAS